MVADPRSEALVANFAGQWLHLRNLRGIVPNSDLFPDFDDNLRQAFRRETELFFGSVLRDNRSVLDLLTGDYTFVNERLARHYNIPGVFGSHFRQRAADRRRPPRAAGQGRGADGHVPRQHHVAGAARQVGARERARVAAAGAAARRAGARRGRVRARAAHDAAADGAAPGERRVRRLPPADGPDRVRARELRRRRARGGCATRPACRSTPPTCWPTATRSTASQGLREALAEAVGRLRADADREAADLCARSRPQRRRHARWSGRSSARAKADQYRFSTIVLGIVNSAQFQMRSPSAAPESRPGRAPIPRCRWPARVHRPLATQGDLAMFITKTSLPRRTFLRGMGATIALPLLDAMVPAATALAQTAAARQVALRLHATCRTARTWRRGRRRPPGAGFDHLADAAGRSSRSRTRWW